MPFYKDHVYPDLVSMLGNPKPIQKIRPRLVPLAQGTVLEIGVGPGVNFVHYDPARVSKVYALESNPGMIRRAEQQRRRTELDVPSKHSETRLTYNPANGQFYFTPLDRRVHSQLGSAAPLPAYFQMHSFCSRSGSKPTILFGPAWIQADR